ncbi:MAG: Ldh family oxidoreductase [Acidobacteria bacterium]|nr:MAG: Ldh family oxidoreductase [Acidobacteriota bacterium]
MVHSKGVQATKRMAHKDLIDFIREVLSKAGAPDNVARIEAEITAEVDLAGVHSHGVQLVPGLAASLRAGRINANPQLTVVTELPAAVLYQADRAIGRYTSALAMDAAVTRAEVYGVGLVSVRGVAHWGRGYSYALRAARAGYIGLAFTNATVNFPAWGTKDPCLGNNPIAIGVPAGEGQEPAVLDIAMTQAAVRKIMDAAAEGRAVPVGWGVDEEGRVTKDPRAILESRRILPMGGHKGSGLAFMIELLTGALAGGLLCFEQGKDGRPDDFAGGSSKTFIALRPFGAWLESKTEALKNHLKSATPAPEQGEVSWPGEHSHRCKLEYEASGIPFRQPLVAKLEQLSADFSVALRWM